jgi:hypothetical protein
MLIKANSMGCGRLVDPYQPKTHGHSVFHDGLVRFGIKSRGAFERSDNRDGGDPRALSVIFDDGEAQ